MGIGGSVIFSTKRGSGMSADGEDEQYFTAAVIGSVILAALAWVGLILFERPLLMFFGTDETLLALAQRYMIPVKVVFPLFLFNRCANDGAPALVSCIQCVRRLVPLHAISFRCGSFLVMLHFCATTCAQAVEDHRHGLFEASLSTYSGALAVPRPGGIFTFVQCFSATGSSTSAREKRLASARRCDMRCGRSYFSAFSGRRAWRGISTS